MSSRRKNPRPPRTGSGDFWLAAVSSAYRSRNLDSQLVQWRGENLSFQEICNIASDVIGEPPASVRSRTLFALRDYVRKSFERADDALRWLAERDQKLAIWCVLPILERRFDMMNVPMGKSLKRLLSLYEELEAYAQGKTGEEALSLSQVLIENIFDEMRNIPKGKGIAANQRFSLFASVSFKSPRSIERISQNTAEAASWIEMPSQGYFNTLESVTIRMDLMRKFLREYMSDVLRQIITYSA